MTKWRRGWKYRHKTPPKWILEEYYIEDLPQIPQSLIASSPECLLRQTVTDGCTPPAVHTIHGENVITGIREGGTSSRCAMWKVGDTRIRYAAVQEAGA